MKIWYCYRRKDVIRTIGWLKGKKENRIMANRFQKFIYYFSAEAPVLIVFAILWLWKKSKWTKPVSISWKTPALLVVASIVLIVLFNIFFNKAKSGLSVLEVKGTAFRSADGWLIAYVGSYLLPLASLAWGDVAWVVLAVVLFILMAILVFSDYVTPHPLLFCKGYHFYELDMDGAASGFTVISKKPIRNVNDFKKVSRVFEFLLIRMG